MDPHGLGRIRAGDRVKFGLAMAVAMAAGAGVNFGGGCEVLPTPRSDYPSPTPIKQQFGTEFRRKPKLSKLSRRIDRNAKRRGRR